MLRIKHGVRLLGLRPEILIAIQAADGAFAIHGHDCVITSGTEGEHIKRSLHYKGLAVDFRTHHVRQDIMQQIFMSLSGALGESYDVVLYEDHLHVEFDPE